MILPRGSDNFGVPRSLPRQALRRTFPQRRRPGGSPIRGPGAPASHKAVTPCSTASSAAPRRSASDGFTFSRDLLPRLCDATERRRDDLPVRTTPSAPRRSRPVRRRRRGTPPLRPIPPQLLGQLGLRTHQSAGAAQKSDHERLSVSGLSTNRVTPGRHPYPIWAAEVQSFRPGCIRVMFGRSPAQTQNLDAKNAASGRHREHQKPERDLTQNSIFRGRAQRWHAGCHPACCARSYSGGPGSG